ncbi:uncharacterized protein TNCV_3373171 [Trichonephila clavipes]|nr:uncharacterized protein TNCV_3373171 [Trichonephila clavipes]
MVIQTSSSQPGLMKSTCVLLENSITVRITKEHKWTEAITQQLSNLACRIHGFMSLTPYSQFPVGVKKSESRLITRCYSFPVLYTPVSVLSCQARRFLLATAFAFLFAVHQVAAVAEWYRYRIVACLLTNSNPIPLKTRRVGQRSTLNLSRAETSSRWCGVVVRRSWCQLRCRSRHLTMVPNHVVRRQMPSCSWLINWRTAKAKRLKESSPMLMEFLTSISHIFSGSVVKKLPSLSVSPSGPPTEDSSSVPTHKPLDDAYQHIRDLEKQVALSEGKFQDSVISSLASHIKSTISCVSDLRSFM